MNAHLSNCQKPTHQRTQSLIISMVLLLTASLNATPPRHIPADLTDAYTLGKTIPVHGFYCDDSYPPENAIIFNTEQINGFIQKAQLRHESYYGATDTYLYGLLDKYASYFKGKTIGIVGSTVPWYESIALAYGGAPTSIDYNTIISNDPRIKTMTVAEYEMTPQKFDALLCISSVEHDGLGRYGDPLDPFGDLRAMRTMLSMLNEGGILILAVPVGPDAVYWNAHRQYGPLRLPLLLHGWQVIDSSGFSNKDFLTPGYIGHQPVFVLKPLA